MKNFEIVNIFSGLTKLRKSDIQTLPTKVSFAIIRNYRNLQPIVEDYEKVKMQLVLDNGGTEDPNKPGVYTISNKDKDELKKINKELESLMNVDNPNVNLVKIKLSDLDNINLSLDNMDCLYSIIEED